jgi:hypothetical protein
MATINLRELRRRLPYGSIVRIADATGISAKVVSEVLNNGWHVQLRGRVCDAALSILDETKIDPDVIKHAEELGVASAHSIYVPARSRKKKPILYKEPEEAYLTWDDLCEMDFDELADLCEELELDTDPEDDDFAVGIGTTKQGREDDLREAIADELEIDIEDDIEDDEEDDQEEEE